MRAHLSNMCLKPSGINVLFLLLSPQNKSVHRSRHKILLGRLTFNSLTFREDLGVRVRRLEQSLQHSAYRLPGSSLMNRFSLGKRIMSVVCWRKLMPVHLSPHNCVHSVLPRPSHSVSPLPPQLI